MLADEVTHVKMGSDWLRRLTENDPERRDQALEFQRVVDKLFSLGGFRGEEEDSPIRWPAASASWPASTTEEIDEIAELSSEARGRDGRAHGGRPSRRRRQLTLAASRSRPRPSRWSSSTRPRSRRWSSGWSRQVGCSATATSRSRSTRRCPLARARIASTDPVVLAIDGGAFEDPKRLRQSTSSRPSRDASAGCCSRSRIGCTPTSATPPDRRRAAAARNAVAWDVYAVGRLGRLGYDTPTASGGSTTSATATASPTPPTRRSSSCGPATASPGPTSTGSPPTPSPRPASAAVEPRSSRRARASVEVVGADRRRAGRSRAGVASRPVAGVGHLDHLGGVEVGPLGLGRLPLLDDHEAARTADRRARGRCCDSPERPRLTTTYLASTAARRLGVGGVEDEGDDGEIHVESSRPGGSGSGKRLNVGADAPTRRAESWLQLERSVLGRSGWRLLTGSVS